MNGYAVREAAKAGHKNVVKYLTENNEDEDEDFSAAFDEIVKNNDIDLIVHFIENLDYDWNDVLFVAAALGNYDMIDYVVSSNSNNININDGLAGASASGNREMIDYLESLGANDWERANEFSWASANPDVIEYITSRL